MELSSSKTMDKYEEIGKEFLKEYYYFIDMKQDMNVSKYIKDENVLQYVDLKHDIIKNRNVRFDIDVSSFSLEVSVYDYQVLDNNVVITYNTSLITVKNQMKS